MLLCHVSAHCLSMAKRHRNRIDIIAEILKIARDFCNLQTSHFMYGAFFTFAQVKGYLVFLEKNGLLEYNYQEERTYKITEKGLKFLTLYEKLQELAPLPYEEKFSIMSIKVLKDNIGKN